MTVMLALLLQQDPDQALREFESAWSKKTDDASRIAAITSVSIARSDKILDSLIEKLQGRGSDALLEALVKGIRVYANEKAIDTLYKRLKDFEKKPAVFQAVVEGIGMGKKLSRPRVEDLYKYFKPAYHQETSIQVPVIRALGSIRHKSSVEPLLERLKKAQSDMQQYIGKPPPGCDGD